MLDPYRMVAVNVISSFILLCGILFYRFIFPKKGINLFFLLILISILPTISIFRTGTYESGDFNIHIYRAMDFYTSLREGNLMPSWAGNLNATYGYPLFIFNYTLPYYVVSLFHLLESSLIGSLKIFLGLNLILSGGFMFLFTKKIFKNNLAAFVSSIFYVFAPYHLIDVHFKIVIGEVLFFTILPLAFLGLVNLVSKPTIRNILFFSTYFAGLIASHLIIAIFAGILLLAYAFFRASKSKLKSLSSYLAVAFFISLLATSYIWIGPLIMSKYSFIQNVKLGTAYLPTLQDLLYSPWRTGFLFQGPNGEISYLLGYIQIFVVLLFIFLLLAKKALGRIRKNVIFWLISFFVTVFIISSYSRFVWEFLPFLKVVGSHRLLILTSFISSILAGYLAINLKRKWKIYLIIVIAIGSTILNWGQRRVIPQINDSILKANLWKSTSEGEAHFYANTKWVDVNNPWFSKLPKNHLEIINGIGNIKNISRNSTLHRYAVTAKTPLVIQENTLYFPGWKGFINGREIALSPSSKGIIQATLPEGIFTFGIKYEDLFIYKLLKIISFSALLLTAILTILLSTRSRIN